MKSRVLFFVKNSIHFLCIGFAAAAMTAETFIIFNQKIRPDLVVFIGLVTLFGYHFWNRKLIFRVLGWVTGIVAASIFFMKNWSFNPPIGVALLLLLAYYFPKKIFRFRSFTFLKPLVIAIVWTICTDYLIEKMRIESQPFFDSIIYQRFFFVAALAIGTDIIDFSIDSAAGLQTIPVRFGKVFARNLSFVFLFFAFFFAFFNPDFGPKRLLALAISFVISGFLIQKLTTANWSNSAKIWVDSMMILQFFLIWVG